MKVEKEDTINGEGFGTTNRLLHLDKCEEFSQWIKTSVNLLL